MYIWPRHLLGRLCLRKHEFKNITVSILSDLCSYIIVGHDNFKRPSSLQRLASLDICNVDAADRALLFTHLSPNYSQFIDSEIQNLLKEGIIEKDVSPWHA
ncbi:hypothetical protein PR048_025629 [Dryococelus australis]|uniref:Uncharacterized protein n=1 Tax=Dryococelus australis TaxID=614101 RepID=A0ABQ9GRX0_9NEOP|nr:hypothetical protein PR048_025629 [Dryococelus australis]